MITLRTTSLLLTIITVLLLQLLPHSQGVIYLEQINQAQLYDGSDARHPPDHFLSHELTISPTAPTAGDAPSSSPSSHLFDRRLTDSVVEPFDDLAVIYSPSDFVYYDSKQARFGSDFGPRGNFEVANLMLPPRGLWGRVVAEEGDSIVEFPLVEVEGVVVDAVMEDVSTAEDVSDSNQEGDNATHLYALSANNTSNSTAVNQTRVRGLQHENKLRHRIMESIDEFLGLVEPTHDDDNATNVNGSIIVSETLDESTVNVTSLSQQQQYNQSNTTLSSIYSVTVDNQVYISDYFCLEDFVEWKTQLLKCNRQQRRQKQQELLRERETEPNSTQFVLNGINETLDGHDNSTDNEALSPIETTQLCNAIRSPLNQTIATNTTNNNNNFSSSNPNYINSTRPITLLALRGRCSFESKAQMALLLNEVFIAQGKSNRIASIIVYNNQTQNNNTEENEALIDMGLASQTFEEWASSQQEGQDHGYKVGMLYIDSPSGGDLIRRIKDHGGALGLNPHLNVEGLFTNDDDAITTETDERYLEQLGAEDAIEESIKGDYNNTIETIQKEEYDPSITHGWYFPATLTRFCLSCGPESNYGYNPPISKPVEISDTTEPWGHDWYSGGWDRPPQDSPNPPSANDTPTDPGSYIIGSYYIPEEWVEAVRKLMISVLTVLLIGPIIFAAWRWHAVGGTVRLARDENGVRRLRLIAPNMEEFVNGHAGTVERNGAKLDRAQVFALPEMEYVCVPEGFGMNDESCGIVCEIGNGDSTPQAQEDDSASANSNGQDGLNVPHHAAPAQSPPTPSSTVGDCLETGLFVSSTCCSICIEEFEHGEKLRILPRCSHAFHTECILPWLTERQGCCPLCKTPVLPEEYQRNRRARRSNSEVSSSPRNRIMRSLFRQSTTVETDVGVPSVNEIQHDLEGSVPDFDDRNTLEQERGVDQAQDQFVENENTNPLNVEDALDTIEGNLEIIPNVSVSLNELIESPREEAAAYDGSVSNTSTTLSEDQASNVLTVDSIDNIIS